MTADLIAVARIVKVRGLRGEVAADVLTDFPERFADLNEVVGIAPDQRTRSLQIEEYWFHGNRVVLKFTGYDSIDAAKELVGYEVAVPSGQRVKLPPNQFYEWGVGGGRGETVASEPVGGVRGGVRTGGGEILGVGDGAGRGGLVPMAGDICVEVDVDKQLIRIDPPAGLLEL